jgi:hypothetical protein
MREEAPTRMNDSPPSERVWAICAARMLLMIAALAIWFGTQALLAKRAAPIHRIDDHLFALTAGANSFLRHHPVGADDLLIVSSALIDLLGIFILLKAAFGPTIRPFLGLLMLFVLRQICQGLISLPAPEGMIWHDPGFPTLLVTYSTSTDLFFSGHTAIAAFGATELARLRRRWLTRVAVGIAILEASVVIVLRAHYTMDVLTGILAALWFAGIAERLAPPVDRTLARLVGRRSTV